MTGLSMTYDVSVFGDLLFEEKGLRAWKRHVVSARRRWERRSFGDIGPNMVNAALNQWLDAARRNRKLTLRGP